MKLKLAALLMMALSLTACAKAVGTSEPDTGTIADGGRSQPEEIAPFDYGRFMYGAIGACGSRGFYFKLLAADNVVIGQRQGQDVMVDSRILLHPGNRFEVEITEKYILSYTDSGFAYKKLRSRYVSGSYVEADGKLVLGDLMEIIGREVDKKNVARIRYLKNVMSSDLRGQVTNGHMVWSSSAIRSEREACPGAEDMLGDFAKFQARANRSQIQLNALRSDQQIYSNEFYIKNMRLVLQNDGSYAIVAQGAAPGEGTLSTIILESGYWSQVRGALKLYNGILTKGFAEGEAVLRFTRDLTVFVNDKAYSVPMIGKSVSMKFGPSDLTIDDLTDTYR